MPTTYKKISALPGINIGALDGTEMFELVQGGINVSMTLADLVSAISGGGGGLPGGDPYQVLMLEADGATPTFGNIFLDTSGMNSIDIFNRIISDSSGSTFIDYENGYIYGADMVINATAGQIYDGSSRDAISIGARQLIDQYGNDVLDWDNSELTASGGWILDWVNHFWVNNVPWSFSGRTPTNTETGWHPAGTYSFSRTFSNSSTVTLQELADVVSTMINAFVNKGLLLN